MSEESMSIDRRPIGNLDCAVVDSPGCDGEIRAVVVLCHGFGAPGEDLVPCAPELFGAVAGGLNNVRFVFPAAPIMLDQNPMYESRAWWPLDMVKLQQMMESGEVRDLRKDRPELLNERKCELADLLTKVADEANLEMAKFVVGGFSQGSMLATEVALSMDQQLGGLIVWSGSLLSENVWREHASKKKGLRVLQTHGTLDPILPFQGAELLKEMFDEFELECDFVRFAGQHTIPRDAITKAAALIEAVRDS